jgi:hypothetical protein
MWDEFVSELETAVQDAGEASARRGAALIGRTWNFRRVEGIDVVWPSNTRRPLRGPAACFHPVMAQTL